MNPYLLLAVGAAWLGSVGATGWWAYGAGKNAELATQVREARVAQVSREAASTAAAKAIAEIEVKNVTIRQPLETIIRTERVFTDCRSGADAVRLLNSTPGVAPAASQPAGARVVPPARPAR